MLKQDHDLVIHHNQENIRKNHIRHIHPHTSDENNWYPSVLQRGWATQLFLPPLWHRPEVNTSALAVFTKAGKITWCQGSRAKKLLQVIRDCVEIGIFKNIFFLAIVAYGFFGLCQIPTFQLKFDAEIHRKPGNVVIVLIMTRPVVKNRSD